MKFRTLRADEIECRINTVSKYGVTLLLYKDARCDMTILDESVGAENWQRFHKNDNVNCTVSIWDTEKKQWIHKEDVGEESNVAKAKGLASDSFKRACVNWGIGRELYTAPYIFVSEDKCHISPKGNGYSCADRFAVDAISYDDCRKISALRIVDKKKQVVFEMGKHEDEEPEYSDKMTRLQKKDLLKRLCKERKVDLTVWLLQNNRTIDTVSDAEVTMMINALTKEQR